MSGRNLFWSESNGNHIMYYVVSISTYYVLSTIVVSWLTGKITT